MVFRGWKRWGLAILVLVAGQDAGAGSGRRTVPGPVSAEVLKVIDGDTLRVRAQIWIGQSVEVSVRIAGLDTPELRGRCREEQLQAMLARDELERLVRNGRVRLFDVDADKYGRRVMARIENSRGVDLGKRLIEGGFGRAYSGRRRQSWCGASG